MSRAACQNEAVFDYMLAHGESGITTQDARRLGILSLSRRICDLTAQGHVIRKEWVKVKSRWGKTQVRRYILAKENIPKQPDNNLKECANGPRSE